jgi:PilZ domain
MENDHGDSSRRLEVVFRRRVPRAQRYEIDTTMRYRIRGEKQWREGVVKNISISGVLIHGVTFLEQETEIEVWFSLPVHLRDESAAELLCRGSVVRSSKCEGLDKAAIAAARIEHWRFLRKKNVESESPEAFSKGNLLQFE